MSGVGYARRGNAMTLTCRRHFIQHAAFAATALSGGPIGPK